MNSHNIDKKIEKILDELNKVLDEVIEKKTKISKDEFLVKTDENDTERTLLSEAKDEKIVSEKTSENEKISEKSLEVERKISAEHCEDKPELQQVAGETVAEFQEYVSDKQEHFTEKKIEVQAEPETITKGTEESVGFLTSIVLYPSADETSKDLFINNINSVLTRVSKDKICLKVVLAIKYASLREEVLEKCEEFLAQVGHVKVAFLIVNEITTDVEQAEDKLKLIANTVKIIPYKEIKLKSTYLDLAIDLLLNTK
ncbi:MAG: hypothetical protein NZ928_01500 [Endomicrobia bacterium]|nr:hypothetical protein [Endomicrobiia bacterium]MDW8055120.1 hypothetical protein [Elusimicrobiota bacterium]